MGGLRHRNPTAESLFERLDDEIYKDEQTGCWVWYGHLEQARFHKHRTLTMYYAGKKMPVTRLVYLLTHGSIKEGYCVSHTCGNKLCLNPAHLTQDDKRPIPRSSAREPNPSEFIRPSLLKRLREHLDQGHAPADIALTYNLELDVVERIAQYKAVR